MPMNPDAPPAFRARAHAPIGIALLGALALSACGGHGDRTDPAPAQAPAAQAPEPSAPRPARDSMTAGQPRGPASAHATRPASAPRYSPASAPAQPLSHGPASSPARALSHGPTSSPARVPLRLGGPTSTPAQPLSHGPASSPARVPWLGGPTSTPARPLSHGPASSPARVPLRHGPTSAPAKAPRHGPVSGSADHPPPIPKPAPRAHTNPYEVIRQAKPPVEAKPAADSTAQQHGAPRGLANHCLSCAINAITQLLLHDAAIRNELAITRPQLALAALANAYASPHVDANALDRVYERYLNGIYALLLPCAIRPGDTISAVDLWSQHRCGLGLQQQTVLDDAHDAIPDALAAGVRAFSFALPAPFPEFPDSFANSNTGGYASFVELPERERLLGLVVQTGNHYVAYLQQHGRWWLANDSNVRPVSVKRLEDTLVGTGETGIELALYAP